MSVERILCFTAAIPSFPRNREFKPKMLIFHAIKPRQHAEKSKFGPILQIPC